MDRTLDGETCSQALKLEEELILFAAHIMAAGRKKTHTCKYKQRKIEVVSHNRRSARFTHTRRKKVPESGLILDP